MSDNKNSPIIEEVENGPLVVKNVDKLVAADGTAVDAQSEMALCRCGSSKNKPFCDGSHLDIGFSSAYDDISKRDRVYTYAGRDITVHYNRLLCSHAAKCGAMLNSVFDVSRDPWIDPDQGAVDEIMAVVNACPSGALSYSENNGEPCHLHGAECVIEIEEHGPYHIRNVEIKGAKWATQACEKKYVLCRCGHSRNKPFCDGAHVDIGWRDDAD